MESPNILMSGKNKRNSGFTLIELLIVMGLFVMILSLGLVIGFDSFRRDSLIAERNTLISALQKARSQAVNNIGDSAHGFYFTGANYVIFEGTSSVWRNESQDFFIPKNSSISVSASDLAGVVFSQLSGDATPTPYEIIISDGISSSSVSVNEEGRINW
jgi:prepilin-type N-terminal cleavage/methylation domain-containing protein